MKRIFNYINGFPSDSFGAVSFAPPTFWEQLWGAAFMLFLLIALFAVIGAVSRLAVWLWDLREAGRPNRYGVRRTVL